MDQAADLCMSLNTSEEYCVTEVIVMEADGKSS